MFQSEDDGIFRGAVRFFNALLNNGCIENKHVAADAAIAATKLEHQHRAVYAQESATACADEVRAVHVVKGVAGTIKSIKFGCVVANIGVAVIDIDLLKDGVSILTAKIQLTSGEAAYELVAGTIDTPAVAAGDVLEIDVDGTAGGGTLGKGVFGFVDLHEDET